MAFAIAPATLPPSLSKLYSICAASELKTPPKSDFGFWLASIFIISSGALLASEA